MNVDLRKRLLDIARSSIHHGLQQGSALPIDIDEQPEALRAPGASFVTLYLHGELRGCVGSLEAQQPLADDLAHNAWAAAFADTRFTPLKQDEWPHLRLQIAILGMPEPLDFVDEKDLLEQLRPGIDGLTLYAQGRRATFLPSVWQSLPDPAAFWHQLKAKAGLARGSKPDGWRVERYTTESFGDEAN
jgi:AmmeMemoRadiSam system protein A